MQSHDIPSEKAEYLYTKFLSLKIQEEVVRYKNDYNAMKKVLIQRYGNLKYITNKLLLHISSSHVPISKEDICIKLDYYRKLHFVFQNINELLSLDNVPPEEIQEYLFSNDFITNALLLLPQEAEMNFIKCLQDLGENTMKIKGRTTYKVLLATVNQYFDIYLYMENCH